MEMEDHRNMKSRRKKDAPLPRGLEDKFCDAELPERIKLKIESALTIEEMAEHESEIEIHHSFTDHELMDLFSEVGREDSESSDNDVDNGPTLVDKIQGVRTTLSLLFDNAIENETAIRQVRRILLELCRDKANSHTDSLKQSDIRALFKQ